jgi:hypothetical protein|nr:MAG TPA: hypothetical protein [Caudoviricetes sp.]
MTKRLSPEEKARRARERRVKRAARKAKETVQAARRSAGASSREVAQGAALGKAVGGVVRQKTNADSDYNVRRRARREVERLQKIGMDSKTTPLQRKAAREAAESLQETIGRTYARVNSKADREQAFNELRGQFGTTHRVRSQAQARQDSRNRSFARQLNLALAGQPSAINRDGFKGQAMAIGFMNAFADERRGHRRSEQYELILRSAGSNDLEQVFRETMRQNRDEVREMMRRLNKLDSGDGSYDDTSMLGDDEGDAKYMSYRVVISGFSYNRA